MEQEGKSLYFSMLETILRDPKHNFGDVKNIVEITPNSRINEDLGLNSIACYELIFAVEEQSGVIINDEESYKLKSVKDFEDYLISHPPRKTY